VLLDTTVLLHVWNVNVAEILNPEDPRPGSLLWHSVAGFLRGALILAPTREMRPNPEFPKSSVVLSWNRLLRPKNAVLMLSRFTRANRQLVIDTEPWILGIHTSYVIGQGFFEGAADERGLCNLIARVREFYKLPEEVGP
jgi:hypothetical protein